VEESLIVALQLVVEDDTPDPAAIIPQSLLGALVGAIDIGVVRQLARLPETGPERLTGLVRAVVAFVSVGFEEISRAVRQGHGAVVGTNWTRTQQPLLLEVALRLASFVSAVMEITLGDDPKGADGGKHSAFGVVNLVHPIAVSHWPTLTAPWQIEVLREHVTRLAFLVSIAIARTAAATKIAIPGATAVAVVAARIVPVEHAHSIH
jgi:hypothetical protein